MCGDFVDKFVNNKFCRSLGRQVGLFDENF